MPNVDELREQAEHLIVEQLRAVETMQGSTNHEYYAEKLLRQLEPVIWEYAPVPARILLALKYGNQAMV